MHCVFRTVLLNILEDLAKKSANVPLCKTLLTWKSLNRVNMNLLNRLYIFSILYERILFKVIILMRICYIYMWVFVNLTEMLIAIATSSVF